ncbi:YsnF/AvaK domain-containing protein [Phenylobacterium deserti]|uniref:DUF2382 domain-containing protein n=1 Tax=Phenylobacterium deserti TaxID=1914756 RepID=A0A328AEQ0_9CAUL|nr:hypothetical protein DJ018_10840 [Phenylobacterium deserti]
MQRNPAVTPVEAIPIVEEKLHVTKQAVETDRVRVTTQVEERPVVLETALERQELDVERRTVNHLVFEAPPPRQEGDCLILSVVEERAVVVKQLFVIEEVIVRRRSFIEPVEIPGSVRATRAVVEHLPTDTDPQGADARG